MLAHDLGINLGLDEVVRRAEDIIVRQMRREQSAMRAGASARITSHNISDSEDLAVRYSNTSSLSNRSLHVVKK